MLDSIQQTAQKFVEEINKREASMAPEYQKDIERLKAISDKILLKEKKNATSVPPLITTTPPIKRDEPKKEIKPVIVVATQQQ